MGRSALGQGRFLATLTSPRIGAVVVLVRTPAEQTGPVPDGLGHQPKGAVGISPLHRQFGPYRFMIGVGERGSHTHVQTADHRMVDLARAIGADNRPPTFANRIASSFRSPSFESRQKFRNLLRWVP